LQSDERGGGGVVRPAPRFAYTEKFYEVFPFYLAIGMTAEQYWDGDCELVRYYRKAAKIRQDLKNQDAWLQGMYIYQAIGNLAPILRAFAKKGTKAVPYPDQPFALNTMQKGEKEQAKQEKQDEKAKAYFQALAMSFNKKFQEKGGGVNG
jgi:hypothetical protein